MRQTVFGAVILDGCTTCNLLWFDQDEWAETLREAPHPLDVTKAHRDEDVKALKDSREPHRVGVEPFFLKPRPTPVRDLLTVAALHEASSLEMATHAVGAGIVSRLHGLATLLQAVYLIFEDFLPDDAQADD